jgi:hypothetical protein
MHPPHVREHALALIKLGVNDCEVSRRIGIPRSTVRDWRDPPYIRKPPAAFCHRCWLESKLMRFTSGDYAELLGLYLGDGCISKGARTFRLRICLDAKYPEIISDTKELLERCLPENPVGVVGSRREKMLVVSVYSYLTYHFCNNSEDIIDLFTGACRLVGIEYRLTCWRGKFNVRINGRASVKRMLAEVGVKS